MCHDQAIGNLYRDNFEAIWNGKAACVLRQELLASDARCRHCDYFRLCLSSHFIDLEQPENYFSQDMLNRLGGAPLPFSTRQAISETSPPERSQHP